MVFRVILFVREFMIDLVAIRGMSHGEKDLEIMLLRQQLRIVERKQERGPRIPRWQREQVSNGRATLEENVRLFKPDT